MGWVKVVVVRSERVRPKAEQILDRWPVGECPELRVEPRMFRRSDYYEYRLVSDQLPLQPG